MLRGAELAYIYRILFLLSSPVDEARKMQPQAAKTTQLSSRAYTGTPSLRWMTDIWLEKTRALSLAKAQVIRDEVWKIAMRMKNARNGEAIKNATAAASDLIACLLISNWR